MIWSEFLDIYLKKFLSNESDLTRFKKLSNNYERIEFLFSFQNGFFFHESTKFLNDLLSNATDSLGDPIYKDNKLSDDYRSKGNKFYERKQNANALNCYTMAILCAIKQQTFKANVSERFLLNKQLIFGYSNRSALFYDEKHFLQTLHDIKKVADLLILDSVSSNLNVCQMLLDLDKKESFDAHNLVYKLVLRSINCFKSLKKVNEINKCRLTLSDGLIIDESDMFSVDKLIRFLKSNENFNDTKSKLQALDQLILSCSSADESPKNIEENQTSEPLSSRHMISDCMDIKYSITKGRHCTANRLIETGECLFVEKPYSAILLPEFSLNYCYQCLKCIYDQSTQSYKFLNIESCDHCSDVLFCSLECKRLSDHQSMINKIGDNDLALSKRSFHRFECKILNKLLHNIGIAHLAYRIVISTDLNTIQKYSDVQRSMNLRKFDFMSIDYRNEKKVNQDQADYEQVFHLLTHENQTHAEDLFKYSLTAILLSTHYNCVLNDFKPKKFIDDSLITIASLILRHIMQTICNAHALTQLNDSNESSNHTFDRQQIRYATGIYPRVSLLNHSCDPNILSSFRQDSDVIIIKASKAIKKSEEIFNCYGPHHLKMSVLERQQSLKDQYHFICDCSACLDQMVSKDHGKFCGLRCIKCASKRIKIKLDHEMDIPIITSSLGNLIIVCESCKLERSFKDYKSEFIRLENEFNSLNSNQSESNYEKLERIISDYSKYLAIDKDLSFRNELNEIEINDNFKLFYLNLTKVVDSLARVNCEMNDFNKASIQIEKNIDILKLFYSTTKNNGTKVYSIEIAYELFKLAEIRCNCMEMKVALKNVNEAISIAENVYDSKNKQLVEFYELRNNILSIL